MDDSDYKQAEIDDGEAITAFTRDISAQAQELVLTHNGATVGAILTQAQYQWFLDQLDQADIPDYLADRANDEADAISLDALKKELARSADLHCTQQSER